MSTAQNYNIKDEPYYEYFILNGYKYLGSGYMHVVFEKDNIIYKLVRSKFLNFDKKSDYEFEQYNLELLRKNGIATPKIIKIYDKDEFIKDYVVFAEKKVNGIVKNKATLTLKNVAEMMTVFEKAHSIKFPCFGQLYAENLQRNTWDEYMAYVINRAKNASGLFNIPFEIETVKKYFSSTYRFTDAPSYLILDPNEENFIFNDKDEFLGVIDIDHPMCFDPLYEPAICLYAKPYIFEMMRTLKPDYFKAHLDTIKMYAYVHSLADILFLYDKDKNLFAPEINFCAKNVRDFHNFLKNYT